VPTATAALAAVSAAMVAGADTASETLKALACKRRLSLPKSRCVQFHDHGSQEPPQT
jgi:hypothetical protein